MDQIRLRVKDAIRSNPDGLNQSALAQQAVMTQDAFSRSLSGQRSFSAAELAVLSRILHVSLPWLITGNPMPGGPEADGLPDGRWQLDRVAQTVAFPAGAYREVELSTESVPVAGPEMAPAEAAALVAERLGSPFGPPLIHDLPANIEDAYGIGVFVAAEGPAFDARAMATQEVTYIVVRGTGAWYHANWVLARELGELMYGRKSQIGQRGRTQNPWASEFANALLLPAGVLHTINWNKQTPAELADFLWEAGVSAKALALRLDALGIARGPAMVHADEGTLQLLAWHNPGCLSHGRAAAYRAPRIPFDLFSAHLKGMREGHVDGTSLAWMLDTPLSEL